MRLSKSENPGAGSLRSDRAPSALLTALLHALQINQDAFYPEALITLRVSSAWKAPPFLTLSPHFPDQV